MSDLIKRLREDPYIASTSGILDEAADEIERLEKLVGNYGDEINRMEKVLTTLGKDNDDLRQVIRKYESAQGWSDD